MNAWWYIFAGVILGSAGDYLMKSSEGFTHLWRGVTAVSLYGANLVLWGIAIKTLPLGSAYVTWMGLGTLAAIAIGMAFFGETVTLTKILLILMVVAGCVGLTITENVK